MSERHLVSIRRGLPDPTHAAYEEAWERLRREATALGAHAWRFRAADAADARLEFLEFKGTDDPRRHPAVRDALADLERLAPGRTEEWREM
jgi:hypothetical protein